MKCNALLFSGHATVQMFKRQISVDDINTVLRSGRIIKNYPDDKPFPSYLVLGFVGERILHVVASRDQSGNCYIITAYQPDIGLWNEDFILKK